MSSNLRHHPLLDFLTENVSKNSKDSSLTGMGGGLSGRWNIPEVEIMILQHKLLEQLYMQSQLVLKKALTLRL